jgi:hypothetical protein
VRCRLTGFHTCMIPRESNGANLRKHEIAFCQDRLDLREPYRQPGKCFASQRRRPHQLPVFAGHGAWQTIRREDYLSCGDRIGTRAESVCAHHCVCNPSVSVSLITSNATCEAGRDQNPATFLPGLGQTLPHLASIRSVV